MYDTIKYFTYFLNFSSVITMIFGSIGNCLVYKLYSSVSFKKFSLSIYFRTISIIDSLNMLNIFILYIRHQFGIDLSQSIRLFCTFQTYLTYIPGAISAWLMVFVSVDRFFKIGYPRRLQVIFNKNIQLAIIVTTIVFNYVYYSFITWNSMIVMNNATNESICFENVNYSLLNWMDFYNSTVIPFLLMILLSLAIIYHVLKSRLKIMAKNSEGQRIRGRDRKFATGLISLNFMFLMLNLPIVIFNLFTIDVDSDTLNVLSYFTILLYYLNSAIGFYVQLIMNSLFRTEFLVLLRLNKVQGTEIATITAF